MREGGREGRKERKGKDAISDGTGTQMIYNQTYSPIRYSERFVPRGGVGWFGRVGGGGRVSGGKTAASASTRRMIRHTLAQRHSYARHSHYDGAVVQVAAHEVIVA